MKLETLALLVTIVSSVAAALIFIWKLGNAVSSMQAELRSQIAESNFDRRLHDERIQHLQNVLTLGFNGYQEKFEHFSTRTRNESSSLSKRVESVENFLTKTTEFEKR